MNHRSMPLLNSGTGPHAHLVAISDVGVIAVGVHIQAQNLDAVFDALGCVELHHLFVGKIVAGCQDHAFRVDLDVLLGACRLGVNARD